VPVCLSVGDPILVVSALPGAILNTTNIAEFIQHNHFVRQRHEHLRLFLLFSLLPLTHPRISRSLSRRLCTRRLACIAPQLLASVTVETWSDKV
jgi:hypothetical protein